MKRIILASALAVACTLSIAAPSQAASVTVITNDGPHHRYDRDHRHHPRARHGCTVKKVKTYRHGAVVWKETKICR